jgi:DnaJ-class molecular chaperone
LEKNKMRIELTDWQTEMLSPFLSAAKTASDNGDPGMLLAQIHGTKDRAYIRVGFFCTEKAKAIQAALGRTVGKTTEDEKNVDVFVPADEQGGG